MAVQPAGALTVALTGSRKTLFIGTYGFANLEARRPLDSSHLFQIGSIGKSFTALALLQLVDEGRLDLDAAIQDLLPWLEIRSDFDPIRVRHLLSHSAGIITGMDESPSAEGEAWALRNSPAAAPPGSYFHYSNTGYKILGLLLETLEEKPYAEIIRDRVLSRLKMGATVPVITGEFRSRYPVAYQPHPPGRPYSKSPVIKNQLYPAVWLETRTADGSIAATPEDMARYMRLLLNRGEGLVSAETFTRMIQPQISTGEGADIHYGYGLVIESGGNRISHGGSMVGFRAHMICDLHRGLGVTVMMSGPGEPEVAALEVLEMIGNSVGGGSPAAGRLKDPRQIEERDELAGEYQSSVRPLTLSIEGDGLRIDEVGVSLEKQGEGKYAAFHPGVDRYFLRVLKSKTGQVFGLAYGPEIFLRKGNDMEIPQPVDRWKNVCGMYRSHNPWYPGFEVYQRLGELLLYAFPDEEQLLVETVPGHYRVGADPRSPEWLEFGGFTGNIAGQAILSGARYYRVS